MGDYYSFTIKEPKERLIMALPFKDKVVLHSLCDNVMTPIFEKLISQGVDLLGFHLYLTETGKVICKIRRESKNNMRHKLHKYKRLYLEDRISKCSIDRSFNSWLGHANHGDSYHLIKNMSKLYDEIFKE